MTASHKPQPAQGLHTVPVERALPNLIIPGAKKAGTTSLYQYLAQHPDICSGTVKHTNFFRPLALNQSLPPLEEYGRYFAACTSQRYRMEASTDYFEGGKALTEGIKSLLEDPRILVSLRDPVNRLWSHYKHKKRESSEAVQGLTFDEYINRCEEAERRGGASGAGTRGYAALSRGRYLDFLQPWLDSFDDRVKIVFLEQWSKEPRVAMQEICAWLGIDTTALDSIEYSVSNPAGTYRSPGIARLASATSKTGRGFFKPRPRLRRIMRKAHDTLNRQQTNESLDPESKKRLRAIYAEPNRLLAVELRRRGYEKLPNWLGSL